MGHAELLSIYEKLPPERQAELIDFAEFLAARSAAAEAPPSQRTRNPEDIARALAQLRESWPRTMDSETIDREVAAMRAEWDDRDFSRWSMAQALRGLEEDPISYGVADIKERWL